MSRIRRQRAVSKKHRDTVAREARRRLHATVERWCTVHEISLAATTDVSSVVASVSVDLGKALVRECLDEFRDLACGDSAKEAVQGLASKVAAARSGTQLAALIERAIDEVPAVVAAATARQDLVASAIAAAADAGIEVTVTHEDGEQVELAGVNADSGQNLKLAIHSDGENIVLDTLAESPSDAVHPLHPEAAAPCLPSEELAARFDAALTARSDSTGLELLDAETTEPSSRGGARKRRQQHQQRAVSRRGAAS